ncbi:MAG: hypothetical protein ACOX6P_11425 [Candidatus Merdivicinus sp.]|jgi:hypothetical protein
MAALREGICSMRLAEKTHKILECGNMEDEEKLEILKGMYRKYDLTSEEQNLLAEMREADRLLREISRPDGWEG